LIKSNSYYFVIPAEAGIQSIDKYSFILLDSRYPAYAGTGFAGMTDAMSHELSAMSLFLNP
jgi:hypothetical protein